MPSKIIPRDKIPTYEILLEYLKETGELRKVVEKCGYVVGSSEFQSVYNTVRNEFYYSKDEEWKIYLKTSRNKDKNVKILRLRYKGYTHSKIAEELDIPISTVNRVIQLNFDKYENSRLKTYAWMNGHSAKPIEKLTNTISIKKRLIILKIKEPICEECGWDYSKLEKFLKIPEEFRINVYPLNLHHIDGNHKNNKLENLKFLCPNCHSLEISTCRPKNSRKGERKMISKNIKSAVIDFKIVNEIRKLYNENYTIKDLMNKFKLSYSSIYRIARRKTWQE